METPQPSTSNAPPSPSNPPQTIRPINITPHSTYNTSPPHSTYNTSPPHSTYNISPPHSTYNTSPPQTATYTQQIHSIDTIVNLEFNPSPLATTLNTPLTTPSLLDTSNTINNRNPTKKRLFTNKNKNMIEIIECEIKIVKEKYLYIKKQKDNIYKETEYSEERNKREKEYSEERNKREKELHDREMKAIQDKEEREHEKYVKEMLILDLKINGLQK